jgi:hypothetical protein
MVTQHCTTAQSTSKQARWNRREIARRMEIAEQLDQVGQSLESVARAVGVPRVTLQNWFVQRGRLKRASGLSLRAVQFFRIGRRIGLPPPTPGSDPLGLWPSS